MARPEFKPTAAMRRRVAVAAGGGMSHEEIAIGLGIARGTLNKYFEHELSSGAYGKRLEALSALHNAAKKGNVAAMKAYLAMNPHLAAPPLPDAPSKAKGKKEQASDDAKTAQTGTGWESLLPTSGNLQ